MCPARCEAALDRRSRKTQFPREKVAYRNIARRRSSATPYCIRATGDSWRRQSTRVYTFLTATKPLPHLLEAQLAWAREHMSFTSSSATCLPIVQTHAAEFAVWIHDSMIDTAISPHDGNKTQVLLEADSHKAVRVFSRYPHNSAGDSHFHIRCTSSTKSKHIGARKPEAPLPLVSKGYQFQVGTAGCCAHI